MIPISSSYSYFHLVYFEDVAVSLGDYFFYKSKRGIPRRQKKRKRVEYTPNKEGKYQII
jgi:hypothetical protein